MINSGREWDWMDEFDEAMNSAIDAYIEIERFNKRVKEKMESSRL